MGAPPGNQYAVGNKGGRYRTTCPPPEEMHDLGKEMCEWVADKKNNCLHLTQWWKIHKHITSNVWDCMCQAKEFIPYYEEAMQIIGIQYLDKNSRVRDGISQRWQRAYFSDLRKLEDDDMKAKAELDAEVAKASGKNYSEQEALNLAALLAQMAAIQSSSNLNTANTNNNTDIKS